MSRDIPERDWKKLRSLKEAALNIACKRIFQKVERLIESRGAESYKYYLKLWKVLREQDEGISLIVFGIPAFNYTFLPWVWMQ